MPTGRSSLQVVLDGPACGTLFCNPDLDLYVRQASRPTTSAYNCRPFQSGSDETCTITSPAAAYWYVGVHTYSGSTTRPFTIRATS